MILTKELRAQVRDARKETALVGGKEVPGSIPFLRGILSRTSDPHDRDDILSELAGEYLRADLDDEHLAVQRERVALHPDAAVMWLGLAHSLSMRDDGADEAKIAVERAVRISRDVGALVRHSLLAQAEVARRIDDSDLFQRTLKELILDAANVRAEDCGLSAHVVNDLPVNFCSFDLEAEYRALLPSES